MRESETEVYKILTAPQPGRFLISMGLLRVFPKQGMLFAQWLAVMPTLLASLYICGSLHGFSRLKWGVAKVKRIQYLSVLLHELLPYLEKWPFGYYYTRKSSDHKSRTGGAEMDPGHVVFPKER